MRCLRQSASRQEAMGERTGALESSRLRGRNSARPPVAKQSTVVICQQYRTVISHFTVEKEKQNGDSDQAIKEKMILISHASGQRIARHYWMSRSDSPIFCRSAGFFCSGGMGRPWALGRPHVRGLVRTRASRRPKYGVGCVIARQRINAMGWNAVTKKQPHKSRFLRTAGGSWLPHRCP